MSIWVTGAVDARPPVGLMWVRSWTVSLSTLDQNGRTSE